MNPVLTINRALAEEIRLRILMCLDGQTLCPSDLANILGVAPSTMSKHLHILSDAGLVSVSRSNRWRYYAWAQNAGNDCIGQALCWARRYSQHDPVIRADAAKRTRLMARGNETQSAREG